MKFKHGTRTQEGKRSRLTASHHKTDTLLLSSPLLFPPLALGKDVGVGRGATLSRSPARPLLLFGEFADDSDERAVLVLQPLVVGSQIS